MEELRIKTENKQRMENMVDKTFSEIAHRPYVEAKPTYNENKSFNAGETTKVRLHNAFNDSKNVNKSERESQNSRFHYTVTENYKQKRENYNEEYQNDEDNECLNDSEFEIIDCPVHGRQIRRKKK